MARTRKSSYTAHVVYKNKHRFEHWYRSDQVYFITARCREKFPAFASPEAQAVFWDRLEHYCKLHGFVLWIATLMNNHYHFIGYCSRGEELGEMMRKIHGSVAKLVNDTLEARWVPFWREAGNKDYFDGCLRDEKQCRLAYRYTLTQAVRAGLVRDWREYKNTRVYIELERGVKRALEKEAFLENVPYKRYQRKR